MPAGDENACRHEQGVGWRQGAERLAESEDGEQADNHGLAREPRRQQGENRATDRHRNGIGGHEQPCGGDADAEARRKIGQEAGDDVEHGGFTATRVPDQ